MEKVHSIEQGVETLLYKAGKSVSGKWSIEDTQEDGFTQTLILPSGQRVPLLWWRYNRKLTGMKNIAAGKLGNLCSVKSLHVNDGSTSLASLLFMEADLASWWLSTRVRQITGVTAGTAAGNFIIKMDNGTRGHLELACTLPKGAEPQSKHTVYSTAGMCSDRVVDTMIVQHGVYVYADGINPITYSDSDVWLYGLDNRQSDTAYCITRLLTDAVEAQSFIDSAAYLAPLIKKVYTADSRQYINITFGNGLKPDSGGSL